MRCTQQDKGPGQGQGQGLGRGRDNKVLKQGWGSMEAPLASRTRLRPLTIPKDTHSGCRLMFEKHTYTPFDLLFPAAVLIKHKTKTYINIKKKMHKQICYLFP